MWVANSVSALLAEQARSADTHLSRLDALPQDDIQIYLKDESTHPTGSLKHRLARSLFLYGLVNGWIKQGRPVIEASSGSTAISEAYFARLIGVPFVAVLPRSTAGAKIEAIRFYGGQIEFVDRAEDMEPRSRQLATESGGHFMDQFTFAERATEWRGNNNIAESLFTQMSQERFPIPAWVVVGAGTGGTAATIGRYIRYKPQLAHKARLCVVDPKGSAYFNAFAGGGAEATGKVSAVVEGIGRPRVEGSFFPSIIDQMIAVPDDHSVGACLWLEKVLGRRVGPSTGTNLMGCLALASEMRANGQRGSIVTLICDDGERYRGTIYDPAWRTRMGLDVEAPLEAIADYVRSGRLRAPALTPARQHQPAALCYDI